jgi:hypothetical protein
MHHFGLEPFSKPEEHWVLQASLTHPISGELFLLVSALDASALASEDLGGTVGATIGSIGPASLTGLSRSKFPVSAHPARATARSAANGQLIVLPLVQGETTSRRIMRSRPAVREMGLKRKVADQLI